MTRLGWFESLVLVAFFFSGLAAVLIGGMWALGYVAQAFFWVSFAWLVRQMYLEYRDTLIAKIEKNKKRYETNRAFNEWARQRQNTRLRGME